MVNEHRPGCPRIEPDDHVAGDRANARHADPRTTEHYDRSGNLDRHGVHFLTAYVAGGLSSFEVDGAHCQAGGGQVAPPLVPSWYRWRMAMNLRLTDEESEALRAKAEQEGRSMQEVAKTAIAQYVSDRPRRLLSAIERVRTEDQELLERLSQ